MTHRKLQCRGQGKQPSYNITLPKTIIEEIALWKPNETCDVLWISKDRPDRLKELEQDVNNGRGFFVIKKQTQSEEI